MKVLLVGHRGVGKSSLLKRIQIYHNKAEIHGFQYFDLDYEIEKDQQTSITNIWANRGEHEFRQLEERILWYLFHNFKKSYIALGAGYSGRIPNEAYVIWVSRKSDQDGRIFLHRPRLNLKVSPLDEYLERFAGREQLYGEISKQKILIREGVKNWDHGEYQFFTEQYQRISGVYTLQKGDEVITNKILQYPCEFYELRNDVLNIQEINYWKNKLDKNKIIKSYRQHINLEFKSIFTDFALELGNDFSDDTNIISLHNYNNKFTNIKEFLDKLESHQDKNKNYILKASPIIHNFKDLYTGHLWQQKDNLRRVFLPRSIDGRWNWYRLFMQGKMPLNFWGTKNEVADWPTMIDWLNHPQNVTGFSAVIGDPIKYSWTPVEHQEFFASKTCPVYAIKVEYKEWEDALYVLRNLGVKALAITSPLKKLAYKSVTSYSTEAAKLQSVNTIYFNSKQGEIIGHNTDIEGLKVLIKSSLVSQKEKIAIWGGGGTLATIKRIFPKAVPYSARTGRPRAGYDNINPQVLIWAAGNCCCHYKPPKKWNVKIVIDLSYYDNSFGKEYAFLNNCDYVNGAVMFYAQAKKQRAFWRKCENGEK